MKRDIKQGWASPTFWRLRDKLAFETNKNKLDVIDGIKDFCESNYDGVVNHIKDRKKSSYKIRKFEMKF